MVIEHELMAGGMPVEAVRSLCDLHSEVIPDVLVQLPAKPISLGHPVATFAPESEAHCNGFAKLRSAVDKITVLDASREP